MGIFDMLFGKKEKVKKRLTLTGPYALIEWDDIAKEFCVGGDELKVIRIYNENGVLIGEHIYSKSRVKFLESQGIPVVDLTVGVPIPEECLADLDVVRPLGVIWQ